MALIDPDGHSSELPCNFGGTGPCIGTFQDPNTSNLSPAKKPGDPFPVADCLGCGSPFGKIADVDVFDYTPAGGTITTTAPVLATLAPSILDKLPVTGPARAFVVNYTNHNFEGALLNFIHLSVDLSPLGSIGRSAQLTTLGLKSAGGPRGFDFAVGLSGHVEKLASETGSLTYNQIAKTGVFAPENFAAIANQARTIRITTQGISWHRWGRWARTPESWSPYLQHVTNWELHQILTNPKWLAKTVFY